MQDLDCNKDYRICISFGLVLVYRSQILTKEWAG